MAAGALDTGTTFISIHSLDDDARILYSSDSVIDILGYTPEEIVNRSAWEFFPPEELPYAKRFHQKRVSMDKAAVLVYCRVRDRSGYWVGCECCFTIVYDVMIVCTSIYKRDLRSEQRAMEAPIVRRIFSNSPKDPRYHMLTHLSGKFSLPTKGIEHEPRAALFLNRFTRTLTIMYATAGVQDIIGIPSTVLRGRSFYYCIAENCLSDAVKCLENAKANDSIAYLRFWFRDPRQDEAPDPMEESDDEMISDASAGYSENGVHMRSDLSTDPSSTSSAMHSNSSVDVDTPMDDADATNLDSRNSSHDSTVKADTHEAIFGDARAAESSTSSVGASPDGINTSRRPLVNVPIELEAVISCTSDGLVVCLRRARPMIPHPMHRPSKPMYENGLFAAPWADQPIIPRIEERVGAGFGPAFAPALGPHGAVARPAASGLPPNARYGDRSRDFMAAIREQAIFAWALTRINGSIAEFGHGKPCGEALPAGGLAVWESDSRATNFNSRSSGGWHNGREMLGSSARNPIDVDQDTHSLGFSGAIHRTTTNGNINSGVNGTSNGNYNSSSHYTPPNQRRQYYGHPHAR